MNADKHSRQHKGINPRSAPSLLVARIALLLVLTGCSGLLTFSPERAVIHDLVSDQVGNFVVDQNSIAILQTQEVQESTFLLVSFSGIRDRRDQQQCLFLYETVKSRLGGWRISSSGGGCTGGALPEPPALEVGSGAAWSSQADKLNYRHVSGLVHQSDIQWVEVTWDNDDIQRVEVIQNSYLAVHPGLAEWVKVEGLNANEEVVYTHEPPEIAPGKK